MDYLLHAENLHVYPDTDLQPFRNAYERIIAFQRALDAASVAATLAGVLLPRWEVSSFSLTVCRSSQLGGGGQMYETHSVKVEDLVAAEPNGPDEDAEDRLQEAIDKVVNASDMWSALASEEDHEAGELSVLIVRARIAPLLAAEKVSGRALYAVLFPERASRLDALDVGWTIQAPPAVG